MRILFLLLLVCGGYWLWSTKERHTATFLSHQLGADVMIERVVLGRTLTFKGFSLAITPDAYPFFEAEEIRIALPWSRLWANPLEIESLKILHPTLFVERASLFLQATASQKGTLLLIKKVEIDHTQLYLPGHKASLFLPEIILNDVGGRHGSTLHTIAATLIQTIATQKGAVTQQSSSPSLHAMPAPPSLAPQLENIRRHLSLFS